MSREEGCGGLPRGASAKLEDPFQEAMLTFNGNQKVYVAREPCDMRKSFNGLSEIAYCGLDFDSLSGAAFLFTNRLCTLAKIIYWDETGY